MRFGPKQMLIVVMAFSAFLGYAISNGIGVAIFFAIVAGLATYCVTRLISGWQSLNLLQRIYGSATAVGSTVLLAFFVISVATSPTFANQRATRNLRFSLLGDERFSSTSIEYHETKVHCVYVEGSVANEADLAALRSEIAKRNFSELDGVFWDLTIRDSGRRLDRSLDSELFD